MLEKARNSESEQDLIRALSLFKCHKDLDIEGFLHNSAIEFLDKDICRVYLILDEDEFDNGIIKVEAYFTLSLRALGFEDAVSKTRRKKITGFKDRNMTAFILIGQLGKYIEQKEDGEIIQSEINMTSILDYVFEVICAINEWIPCNAVLVECSEDVHNVGLYQNEGFTFLQVDNSFYQYYKKIA